jgi:hypothetical protein
MGNSKTAVEGSPRVEKTRTAKARCVQIADRGVISGKDFAKLMSLLIGDIATGRMHHRQADAICNAGGKLLKVVELQHKYGKGATSDRNLFLLS